MNLRLQGEVLSDDWAELYRWFGIESGYYCPGDIRAAVAGLQDGEELVLEINSVGGDCDAASEIYSVLKSCGHPTRAEIQSLAASAASYFPMACDHVAIALPAQMMVHCASMYMGGNKYSHQWASGVLDKQDVSILDTYCGRCGEDKRDRLRQLMDEETFLTATECLELGLADSIIGQETEGEGEPLCVAAAMFNNTVRAMRTLPDIRALKARRDREMEEMAAALAEEKGRYL